MYYLPVIENMTSVDLEIRPLMDDLQGCANAI